MHRDLIGELTRWKSQDQRLPLLLEGARQTGKTYLLQHIFAKHFEKCLRIDFLERPEFTQAFEGPLTPTTILSNLQLLTNRPFDPATDLLILDEIGECPRAVESLKYFAEQLPGSYVTATGSNIGLLNSFPVGKVEQLNLRPLSFGEFLQASGQDMLVQAFQTRQRSSTVHNKLMDQLTDYLYTGGMPAVVDAWFDNQDDNILARVDRVQRTHANLISGYRRDFGKYAGRLNAQLIDAVFTQIPMQLSSVLDDSVKRFRFKDVYAQKSRYSEFENAINWLHHCRLALLNYPIEGKPRAPLVAYRKPNRVKLFLFDVGLVNHMLQSGYKQIKQQAYEYKGFIAENFVQQELAVLGIEPTHSWVDARAEIEFLLTDNSGHIIPLEVKSGSRTRAKSLASFVQKHHPVKTIKLAATAGNTEVANSAAMVLPLYDACFVGQALQS